MRLYFGQNQGDALTLVSW